MRKVHAFKRKYYLNCDLKKEYALARKLLLLLFVGWRHDREKESVLGSGINKNKQRTKSSSFKAT